RGRVHRVLCCRGRHGGRCGGLVQSPGAGVPGHVPARKPRPVWTLLLSQPEIAPQSQRIRTVVSAFFGIDSAPIPQASQSNLEAVMKAQKLVTLGFALALASGCAGYREGTAGGEVAIDPTEAAKTVVLHVRNQYPSSLSLNAVIDG